MSKLLITISREYGSGGLLVGQELAEALGLPCYDKKLLTIAAEKSGFSEEMLRQAESRATNSLLYSLATSLGVGAFGPDTLSLYDKLYLAQFDVIRQVADEGSCVIVGRCADYVLRNQSDVDALNLFIHAPMEERIRRVREEYKVQAPDLRLYILKQDKNRAAYYEHFTDGQWGKAQNYHLAVSSGLGLETIVRLLTDLMRDRGLGA